jgi:hypothetical protein
MRTSLRSQSLLAAAVFVASGAAAFAGTPTPAIIVGHDTAGSPVPPNGTEVVQVAYDYTGTGPGLLDSARPSTVSDFGSTINIPAGFVLDVTQITVARVNGTVGGSFDVGFYLWDNTNPAAPAGTSVNSGLLAAGTFNRNSTGALNSVLTTNFTFTPGTLLLTDSNFGYQMVYSTPGSQTVNAAAGTVNYTPDPNGATGFYEDRNASGIGNSANGFFEDLNANKILESTEAVAFAAPNDVKSNVFLQITGDLRAVPEPTSLGLIGLGGMSLLARRRKA